jgi:hypothetical protein
MTPWLSPAHLCAVVALVLFILAALAFNGHVSGISAHLLLAAGLAVLALAGVW